MKIEKYGLIGHHISYSISPLIHSSSADFLGKKIDYQIYDFAEDEISSFVQKFFADGGRGLNVTTPYKALMAKMVQSSLSAVNVLYESNGKILGASTDGAGLDQGLKRDDIEMIESESLVILGTGGVVVSILEYLDQKSFQGDIYILGRKEQLILPTFKRIKPFYRNLQVATLRSCLDSRALLIQATSAPSHGDDLSSLLPALKDFQGSFVDLIYAKPSSIWQYCKNKGIKSQAGLPMLVEQARLTQEIWWGASAPFDVIEAALKI